MTNALTIPQLTPLKVLAAQLGIPPRRLRERARQFTHVRIGKELYLTDGQMEAFFATFTVGRSTPKSDRDKALEQTRERIAKQHGRRRPAAA